MKQITLLLALLAAGWGDALAGPASTSSAAFNRILMIDASSMPVAGGRATLTIGTLQRADGVYTGDYKLKVFPYFLKNDKGRLTILVSDESMAEINLGNVTTVIGTAATSDRDGRSLHIDATAAPVNIDRGNLKLWFMVGDRKMIFTPAYHFAETATPLALAQTTTTHLMPPRFLVCMPKP